MKNYLILYIIYPIVPVLFALGFEFITDSGQLSILDYTTDYSTIYAIRLVTILATLASLVSVFTWLKNRPSLIMTVLIDSAIMILFDYYVNLGNPESNNLLWLLPMILIVYIAKYNAIVNGNKTSDNNTSEYSK